MPATAVALDAQIEITSVRGVRRVPATEFYLGPYLTILEPDELVTGLYYPDWPAGPIMVFREVAQRPFVCCNLLALHRAAMDGLYLASTPARPNKLGGLITGEPSVATLTLFWQCDSDDSTMQPLVGVMLDGRA